jgi:hypothetical protein
MVDSFFADAQKQDEDRSGDSMDDVGLIDSSKRIQTAVMHDIGFLPWKESRTSQET